MYVYLSKNIQLHVCVFGENMCISLSEVAVDLLTVIIWGPGWGLTG